MPRRPRSDVLLVCSSGGHLLQLFTLREAWADFSRVWVTFDKSDARSLLAARFVARERPRVVLTTGAGVAVPFAWIARLLGARVVYIESLTRIDAPSLSCRLIAPAASRIFAQWPELAGALPRARYVGSVFAARRA